MQQYLEKLSSILFKKDRVSDCTNEELNQLAERYPFFPISQVLLTAKMKNENEDVYSNQFDKASIYFNNPLRLQFVLSNNVGSGMNLSQTFELMAPTRFDDSYNNELVAENVKEVANIISNEKKAEPGQLVVKKEETKTEKKEQQPSGLIFEPYHTVDYFASQGIRQIVEEIPGDRFGKQLKSFTEWLKAIRQMSPQQISNLTDTHAEEKVVTLAGHSLEDRNVETEAMAEVWIKQGQKEKAIAIYEKLSLLNPPKSSYFAGLIEKLKTS